MTWFLYLWCFMVRHGAALLFDLAHDVGALRVQILEVIVERVVRRLVRRVAVFVNVRVRLTAQNGGLVL
jgi:hypothetical protein